MQTGEAGSSPGMSDVIVVGSGVAGLRAAIEAAELGQSVALLAKDSAQDSNTQLAQGGVAVALSDEDQVGLHYRDTLAAGDGLCDEQAVGILVGEGPRYITQLIEWGAAFDREGSRLAFTREAAHSKRRILHAHGDATGREILRALWQKAATLERILFLPHTYSVGLLTERGICRGLSALDETSGRQVGLNSSAVILATGGIGQVYLDTTNPPQATGDGLGIAWRAGAVLRDMEFVQFHPTSLHVAGAPRFLLSEALRGEGGVLRSTDGRRFMTSIDPRAELAPRDVVARAIFLEMARTGAPHVLLDMTQCDGDFLKRRFPKIYETCLKYGVDLASQPAPVVPAAHYAMGGVATDRWGRTTVPGLYAAGEVACTGVHGANRLASNSLLEGLVFGARAGQAACEDLAGGAQPSEIIAAALASASEQQRLELARAMAMFAPGRPGCLASDGAAQAATVIRTVASRHLGIVRDEPGMLSAVESLDAMMGATSGETGISRAGLESLSLATAARLIAGSALARQESRGAHFRSDFPARDDQRYGRSSYIAFGMERAVVAGQPVRIPG